MGIKSTARLGPTATMSVVLGALAAGMTLVCLTVPASATFPGGNGGFAYSFELDYATDDVSYTVWSWRVGFVVGILLLLGRVPPSARTAESSPSRPSALVTGRASALWAGARACCHWLESRSPGFHSGSTWPLPGRPMGGDWSSSETGVLVSQRASFAHAPEASG
jgi:hypothetical protein